MKGRKLQINRKKEGKRDLHACGRQGSFGNGGGRGELITV
jgi:hypothetical protein